MPSLRTLEEFKASFNKIGNEEQVLQEQNLPFDDLPLPEKEAEEQVPQEPAPIEPAPSAPAGTNAPASDSPGPGLEDDFLSDLLGPSAATSAPSSGLPDDFSSILDSIPDDFGEEPAQPEQPEQPEPNAPEDDLSVPPELLDGFGTDFPADESSAAGDNAGAGADSEPPMDFSMDDFGDTPAAAEPSAADGSGAGQDDFNLDIGDLPDFSADLPEEQPGEDTSPDDLGDSPESFADFAESSGLETPSESTDSGVSDESFDLGELPDLDAPAGSGDSTESAEPFDLGELPDLDAPAGSGDSTESAEPFDLGELPDFGGTEDSEIQELSSEDFPADDLAIDDLPTDDFSVPVDSSDESFDIPESSDSDEPTISDEPLDLSDFGDFADTTDSPKSAESADPFDALGSANFGDLPDSGAAPALTGGEESADSDAFDLGGEFPEVEAPSIDTGELDDSFDQFNLEGDGQDGGINLGDISDGTTDDSDKLDEFAIPGLDIDYNLDTGSGAASEPEEIALTDDEVSALKETLSSYPLNLRIACEEIIVEQVVAPDLMSNLIKNLTTGATPKDTAALAGKILGKTVSIPKGFEKKTGLELEEEQASFPYIFVHNFLPVLRVFMAVALVLVSLGYLIWTFVYKPIRAEGIYKRGYEQISEGGYNRARDLFWEAFNIHEKKIWFYRYAEAFRDERQYLFAEEKYDELLYYTASKNKRGIPEKKAVMDYAALETDYLRNYAKADELLRHYILDYTTRDKDALLALGDNYMAWAEVEKERYEDARQTYAIYMERYGRTDPLLERMLRYFIRTDNLGETINLQAYFMSSPKSKIEASTLAELGGYLLDKRTEEIKGVPNQYIEYIGGIRDVLLRAIRADPVYPESYYHLSRYYNYYENSNDEEITLQRAIIAFDAAKTETRQRLGYRIDALRRYAEIHVQRREFFKGEEYLIRGIQLYEDGLSRRVVTASPNYGRLYADLGDLEYFVKDGNALAALDYYGRAEQNGYAPPEILYRMGASYYQLRQWPEALDRFSSASFPAPYNRKILYALGNVSYLRGNYFAAQGYYNRLLEMLENDRARFPVISPTDNEQQLELAERIMVVQNNLAVTLEALALRTGDNSYRSTALGLYSESERAWDVITRNPDTMVRLRPSPEIIAPGINPAYINVQNSLYPVPGFEPLFFQRIDKDLLEPSIWEDLAPQSYSLSEGIATGR